MYRTRKKGGFPVNPLDLSQSPSLSHSSILAVIAIAFLIGLVPQIFYLLTLQKALNRCAPGNRTMAPGLVWLTLIPLFSLIWNFFVVSALSRSLGNEFAARNIPADAQPGRSVGFTFAILAACGIVPLVGIIAALVGFVMWIVYWVKIAGYSSRLA
jgi:hypothetical protein